MLWLCLSFLPFYIGAAAPLHELAPRAILGGAVNGERAVLATVRDGMPPAFDLVNVNFADMTYSVVEDGRIAGGSRLYVVLPYKQGFALFSLSFRSQRSIIILDQNGAFQETLLWDQISGYKDTFFVNQVSLYQENLFWITFEQSENALKERHLALLSLENLSFDKVLTYKVQAEETKPFWISSSNNTYLVFPYTGRVDAFDIDSQKVIRNILPAQKPVETKAEKQKLNGMSSQPEFLKYNPILTGPVFRGSQVALMHKAFLNETETVSFMGFSREVQKIRETYRVFDTSLVDEEPLLTLYQSPERKVVFDPEAGEIQFIQH